MRAAQRAVTAADLHATLATAIDLGDALAPKSSIHPRPKQALGARLAAGALQDLFGLGGAAPVEGPVFAAAAAGGGGGGGGGGAALSATITFAPPYDGPGALALNANATAWPGLAPSSACPPSAICGGFELQDGRTGAWWPANASLRADGGALVLEAGGAPSSAVLNGTSNGFAVWPQVTLFGASALGGLPAYPWRAFL